MSVPWKEILETARFFGYVILCIWGFKFVMFLIGETFGRYCPHCKKGINK